jgi:hypothetical protein
MAIKIIGLQQALKDIDKKNKAIVDAVRGELNDQAKFIEENAVKTAPREFAGKPLDFFQKIKAKPITNDELTFNIGLDIEDKKFQIEAWFEFGTGLSAQQLLSGSEYDEDIRSLAETFKRSGDGTIKSKAYLFPFFFIVRSRIVKELKEVIDKATKK